MASYSELCKERGAKAKLGICRAGRYGKKVHACVVDFYTKNPGTPREREEIMAIRLRCESFGTPYDLRPLNESRVTCEKCIVDLKNLRKQRPDWFS